MPLGTTHPLDADGAISQLYYYLAKEHFRGGQRAHLESARLFIPPTVLFEQGFAKAWFSNLKSSDVVDLEGLPNVQVKRKLGKEVSNAEIHDVFTKGVKHEDDIAATLISPKKKDFGDPGQGATLIQYFTRKSLREFLFAPGQKPKGILQKFVVPKGTNNCTIQATWSQRVTITEGRRNATSLHQYTKSPFERAATIEEPSYGNAVVLTPVIISAVRNVCNHVVHHLYLVEHIRVVGMILLFKVDAWGNIRFLYSLSMRVQTDSGIADFHANNAIPLNLSVRFQNYVTYEKEEAERQNEEAALRSKAYQIGSKTPKLPPLRNEPPQPMSTTQRQHMIREKPVSLQESKLYNTARVCPTYSSIAPLENLHTNKSLRRRVWRGVIVNSALQTNQTPDIPDLNCAKLPKCQSKPHISGPDPSKLSGWLGKQRKALKALIAVHKVKEIARGNVSSGKAVLAPLPKLAQSSGNRLPLRNDDAASVDLAESNSNPGDMTHIEESDASKQLQEMHALSLMMVSSACDYVEELLYSLYSFFLSNTDRKDFSVPFPPCDISSVVDNDLLLELFHRFNIQPDPSLPPDTMDPTRPRLIIPYIGHDVNSRTKAHDSIRKKLVGFGSPPDGLLYKRCCQLYMDEVSNSEKDLGQSTASDRRPTVADQLL